MIKSIVKVLIVIGIIIAIVFLNNRTEEKYYNNDELLEQIDSLNLEISILKSRNDSLQCKLDSSKENIKIIEHWYEKELSNITNQSVADDVLFFSNYISEINK